MTDVRTLYQQIETLSQQVNAQAATLQRDWPSDGTRPDAGASAANLAAYLALRERELRPLQRELMVHGLSSLGRLESRVLPALHAVRDTDRARCQRAKDQLRARRSRRLVSDDRACSPRRIDDG